MWIVGDETELRKNSVWESLIYESKQQGFFIRSTSHKVMSPISENEDTHVNSWDSLCSDFGVVITHVSYLHIFYVYSDFSTLNKLLETKKMLVLIINASISIMDVDPFLYMAGLVGPWA